MPLKTESLASMCEAVVDCPHSTPVWTDSGFVVLRNQNIKDGRLDLSAPSYTDEEHFKQRVRRMAPRPGDIVITREAPMGEVCKIPDGLTCCLGQRQVLLRPKAGINADYLLYALQSPVVQEQIRWNEGTGSTVSNIRIPVLEKIEIPRLGASEQFIAAALKSVDDKIDLNRRINQTLEAMAQAIFQSWFVDFDPVKAKIAAKAEGRDPLRAAMSAISGKAGAELDALPPEQYEQLAATAALFPDEMEESEVGEVPKGWSVGTLSNFASFQNGYAFKTKDWTDSGHPVVKIGNVKPGIIDLSGCSLVAHETVNGLDRFALKKGDLLVGMTGYVGETGLVPALYSVAYLNQRVGRISTVNGVSDIGYPFCLVRDPAYKAYAESKAHGSAQANVSGKDLMDYQAVVPDAGVLKIFNAQVAKIINALLSYHEENQSLAALRDTLLPRLLSGELLVADAMAEAVA